jgi:hypothetical protein
MFVPTRVETDLERAKMERRETKYWYQFLLGQWCEISKLNDSPVNSERTESDY